VGWAMIAGVQSTVWILAISAALTSRAFSYSCWSSIAGYSAASRSHIALLFANEQGVQDGQTHPEIACGPGEVGEILVEVGGRQPVVIDTELPPVTGAKRVSILQI